jgi:hypothetical protein
MFNRKTIELQKKEIAELRENLANAEQVKNKSNKKILILETLSLNQIFGYALTIKYIFLELVEI